jgi:hypothetical protein
MKTFFKIPVGRFQSSFVIINAHSTEAIDESLVQAAIAQTLTESEWETTETLIGKPSAINESEACEYHFYDPKPEVSFIARAREIGVSVVTLRKWRDHKSVAIFNDAAIRAHIAKQRNHNWAVNPKFKATLGQSIDHSAS